MPPTPTPPISVPLGTPTPTAAPTPTVRAFDARWDGAQARITWDIDAVFGCIGRYRGMDWTYLGCEHRTITDAGALFGDEYVLLIQGTIAGRVPLRGVVWLPLVV